MQIMWWKCPATGGGACDFNATCVESDELAKEGMNMR